MRKNLVYASALTIVCLVLAVLTFLVSGCRSLAPHLVNPTYIIRDIRPRVDIALPLSRSSIDFDFLLSIDNPNPIGLQVDRVDFTVWVNDSHILDGYNDAPVRIPSHGIADVHLRARVDYGSLRSLFREVADMVRGNRASYRLEGMVFYRTPFGQRHFPLKASRGPQNRSAAPE